VLVNSDACVNELKTWSTESSNASRTNKIDMLIDMCFIRESFPDSERSFVKID
jgi:hypothetical protein